jgi:8-oxo-dGTP diphosphatase
VDELARTYPCRPWVGVGVIVWRDGKVLLARRARPPRLGEWSIPGGAQQVGETVAQAAEREIFEETGLTVRAAELVSVEDAVTRDADGAVLYHYTLIEIAADRQAGDATAADDVDAVVWATPAEAETLLNENPAARRVLRRAAQMRGFDVKETS